MNKEVWTSKCRGLLSSTVSEFSSTVWQEHKIRAHDLCKDCDLLPYTKYKYWHIQRNAWCHGGDNFDVTGLANNFLSRHRPICISLYLKTIIWDPTIFFALILYLPPNPNAQRSIRSYFIGCIHTHLTVKRLPTEFLNKRKNTFHIWQLRVWELFVVKLFFCTLYNV